MPGTRNDIEPDELLNKYSHAEIWKDLMFFEENDGPGDWQATGKPEWLNELQKKLEPQGETKDVELLVGLAYRHVALRAMTALGRIKEDIEKAAKGHEELAAKYPQQASMSPNYKDQAGALRRFAEVFL